MSGIQAIETSYKGYRFRSRLEARWAVLLDTLGIVWKYEHEGFDLSGVWYLPDFWLPELKMFLEIKGVLPKPEDHDLHEALAKASGFPVMVSVGLPFDQDGGCWTHGDRRLSVKVPILPASSKLSLSLEQSNEEEWGERLTCPVCGFDYVHFLHPTTTFIDTDDGKAWSGRGSGLRVAMWGECGHEWEIRFGFHKGQMFVAFENCGEELEGSIYLAKGNTALLSEAVQKAKSARFEHGESPLKPAAPGNPNHAKPR